MGGHVPNWMVEMTKSGWYAKVDGPWITKRAGKVNENQNGRKEHFNIFHEKYWKFSKKK